MTRSLDRAMLLSCLCFQANRLYSLQCKQMRNKKQKQGKQELDTSL